jgi:hypothetical protein
LKAETFILIWHALKEINGRVPSVENEENPVIFLKLWTFSEAPEQMFLKNNLESLRRLHPLI